MTRAFDSVPFGVDTIVLLSQWRVVGHRFWSELPDD
jgi:hypothetical protein